MKRLVEITQPIKMFAGAMFAGLICLYMISSILYTFFTGEEVTSSIPFTFVVQGLVLTLVIAILREVILGEFVIKKWRFFSRIVVFCIAMLMLLAISAFTFLAIPTELAYLWLASASALALGVTVIFGVSEIYYRKTGKWYNEVLRNYKERR